MRKGAIILLILAGVACNQLSEYDRIKQEQLKSGIKNDSIFLGITFGMEMKDFYSHCWNLNKEGLISQGPGNLSVEYNIDGKLPFLTHMRFYPEFEEGKISKMPVEFSYAAWSPWNKATSADSLMIKVVPLLEQWYGAEFKEAYSEKRDMSIWYNIAGDRQIMLYKKDTSKVRMELTKLTTTVVEDEMANNE